MLLYTDKRRNKTVTNKIIVPPPQKSNKTEISAYSDSMSKPKIFDDNVRTSLKTKLKFINEQNKNI